MIRNTRIQVVCTSCRWPWCFCMLRDTSGAKHFNRWFLKYFNFHFTSTTGQDNVSRVFIKFLMSRLVAKVCTRHRTYRYEWNRLCVNVVACTSFAICVLSDSIGLRLCSFRHEKNVSSKRFGVHASYVPLAVKLSPFYHSTPSCPIGFSLERSNYLHLKKSQKIVPQLTNVLTISCTDHMTEKRTIKLRVVKNTLKIIQ